MGYFAVGRHDPAAFPDGEDLVGFHLRESFEFLRRRPFHLDEIHRLSLSQGRSARRRSLCDITLEPLWTSSI